MLSIIFPVYNEVDSLAVLYQKTEVALEQLGQPFEIIFVDDGSKDGSAELLSELMGEQPHIPRGTPLSSSTSWCAAQ